MLIVTELAHEEGHAVIQATDVELVVEEFLTEGLLGADVPHPEDP